MTFPVNFDWEAIEDRRDELTLDLFEELLPVLLSKVTVVDRETDLAGVATRPGPDLAVVERIGVF